MRLRAKVAGLLLAPGASAGADQPALVRIDRAVAQKGIAVMRIDFPYRLAGRRAPDRPAVMVDHVKQAAASFAEQLDVDLSRIAVGGRSMGGRMCSMAIAEGMPAAALVAVSYPLHPPGRPERTRSEHFARLTVPCLFVSGTRDAFGSPAELEQATASIPGPVTHVWIDGGDHGLRRKEELAARAVAQWLAPRGKTATRSPDEAV